MGPQDGALLARLEGAPRRGLEFYRIVKETTSEPGDIPMPLEGLDADAAALRDASKRSVAESKPCDGLGRSGSTRAVRRDLGALASMRRAMRGLTLEILDPTRLPPVLDSVFTG